MGKILATGVRNVEHIAVFDQIAEERFAAIDLTPLLVYMIDTVPSAALPVLAKQFDVLGYKGWNLTKTEADQRELIKKAIELHRYKGTIWALREAIKAMGFGGAIITEHVGQYYDGSVPHNGSIYYSRGNWANFSIEFDLGNFAGINEQQSADLIQVIEEYKAKRCHLVSLSFVKNITDNLALSDEVAFQLEYAATVDAISQIKYDGIHTYNGGNIHGNIEDINTY